MVCDRLKTQCNLNPISSCKYWPYSTPQSLVIIQPPQVPIAPQVVLQYATAIGECSDMKLDASGKTKKYGDTTNHVIRLLCLHNHCFFLQNNL